MNLCGQWAWVAIEARDVIEFGQLGAMEVNKLRPRCRLSVRAQYYDSNGGHTH